MRHMQKIKSIFTSESIVLVVIAGLVYLPFVSRFGYFNDDWYLMYAAGAKGASVFKDIFIVDRPMRALVMSFTYLLFGSDPVLYNISAWGFRVLSAILFYYFLSLLWPHQKRFSWMTALLYLIYPGFLSQFNGIDYQSQMVSLAVGMLSLLLLFYSYRTSGFIMRFVLFILLMLTTAFYLGLVEYFIGMEVLKLAALILLVFRDETNWLGRIKRSIAWISYSLLALLPFMIWRLFFFHSERGATDVDIKIGEVIADPATSLFNLVSVLLNNSIDVVFQVWMTPLRRVSFQVTLQEWLFGFVLVSLVLLLVRLAFRVDEITKDRHASPDWRIEAIWLGIVMLIFGLLPVILVGRYVDFKSFSRYALAPSIGVVMLWQAGMAYIPNIYFRSFLYILLVVSSSLTHYANGLARVRETEALRNFWWQVSWRIPQLEIGATLVTHYSVAAEEDYFTWGPANLIYYPESNNEKYVQPAVFAALLDQETIEKASVRERQDYSNRRSIVTYPNYRNLLILTQPTSASCVQVVDHNQVELSSAEDERVIALAPYSEVEQIKLGESFHVPPLIPFGNEPSHSWCYFYQKASYARQNGDWSEVFRLGEEARALGFSANNPIEWMPFLQAYAYFDNSERMKEIGSMLSSDLFVAQQACSTVMGMPLKPATMELAKEVFCLEK